MYKTLVMDAETREMRVRYHDLWRGQHEVTEYRVTDGRDGTVVRNRLSGGAGVLDDMIGEAVHSNVPGLFVRRPYGDMPIWTEQVPVGPTVATPCPKATNARRKCAQCQQG